MSMRIKSTSKTMSSRRRGVSGKLAASLSLSLFFQAMGCCLLRGGRRFSTSLLTAASRQPPPQGTGPSCTAPRPFLLHRLWHREQFSRLPAAGLGLWVTTWAAAPTPVCPARVPEGTPPQPAWQNEPRVVLHMLLLANVFKQTSSHPSFPARPLLPALPRARGCGWAWRKPQGRQWVRWALQDFTLQTSIAANLSFTTAASSDKLFKTLCWCVFRL